MGDSAVAGRRVLLAGATSAAGRVVAQALTAAGADVIATGRSRARLAEWATQVPGARTEVCDASDSDAVTALAARIGDLDGVISLVGGWRGGGGLAGQTEDDYRALEASFAAVRATSRTFDAALRASSAGRFAIVSSTVVARPLAGGANYAAVKAASEAWAHAVAQGYAKTARDANEPLRAASVIFRARGALSAQALAQAVVDLWNTDAADLNDRVVELVPPDDPAQ